MGDFKRSEILKTARVGYQLTDDNQYWKRLGFPVAVKDYGAIDYVDVSKVEPFDFAVTCSTKIQIYNSKSNQVSRTISRFKTSAFGANFRNDGKLLISGNDEGAVALFDAFSKAQLRLFKGHKAACHRCCFTNSGTSITSFSDDKTIKIWDIPGEKNLLTLEGHKDYIRTGYVSPANESVILSGSYDHNVKLFDIRSSECVLSVDHGSPVEGVIIFPSGNLFASCGGTYVKVWDAISGRLLTQMSQHHKTITCLSFASNNNRIVSGSLDKQVKIYDTLSYQVVHTLDYPSPILSLAFAPDDQFVVGGMADGLISIRHLNETKEMKEKKESLKKKTHFRFKMYGNGYQMADFIVPEEKTRKLNEYDKFMKSFQSSRALDSVLKDGIRVRKPYIAVSVMQELIRRGNLRTALAGRDADTLSPLTRFISRNLPDPRYNRVLLDVTAMLIDIYGDSIENCPGMFKQFEMIKLVMDKECKYLKEMMEVNGIVQCVLTVTNSNMPLSSVLNSNNKTKST